MQERFTRILLSSILVLSCTVNCYAVVTESTVDEVSLSASKDEQIIHLNDELRKLGRRINGITIPSEIVSGMILMWSGAIADIPEGWQICDGSNSTPDLTDRFVIHADADSGGTRDVGDTGGANTIDLSHTHTGGTLVNTLDTTSAPFTASLVTRYVGPSGDSLRVYTQDGGTADRPSMNKDTTSATSGSTASSLSSTQSVLNKYYALAFIMKL